MKEIFRISTDESQGTRPALALLLGYRHTAFAITDHSSHRLLKLRYYTHEDTEEIIRELLETDDELKQDFAAITIGFQNPGCAVIPMRLVRAGEEKHLLNLMSGRPDGVNAAVEQVPGWQLQLAYPVSRTLLEKLRSLFPAASVTHELALSLRNIRGQGGMFTDFRHDDFSVLFIHNGRLQFAGTYTYVVAHDVLYHLLAVARGYDVRPEEIPVFISGLVDKQSPVYEELAQYFGSVDFRDSDWATEYPAHYFTTLNDLATCA